MLTVTGMLVPPPGSRRAPVQPWPGGGRANRAIPIILVLPGLLAGEALAGETLAGEALAGDVLAGELLPLLPPAQEASAAPAASRAQHPASLLAPPRQRMVIRFSPTDYDTGNEASGQPLPPQEQGGRRPGGYPDLTTSDRLARARPQRCGASG